MSTLLSTLPSSFSSSSTAGGGGGKLKTEWPEALFGLLKAQVKVGR